MIAGATVVSIDKRRAPCAECHLVDECVATHPIQAGVREPRASEGLQRIVHAGEHLFRAGDRFDSIYVVRSGAVKSYLISSSGEEHVVAFHMPRDLLGVDGLATERYASSAVALDTSSVCVLAFEHLAGLCARHPEVQRRLLRGMSQRIRDDATRLLVLSQKSADQRIASFLVSQSQRRAELGYAPDEINLAMPRADVASYLGLAVETVSRVLTRFQEARVLSVARNHIVVLDPEALLAATDAGTAPALTARRR